MANPRFLYMAHPMRNMENLKEKAMKKFLATTATALLLSSPVYADAHASTLFDFEFESAQNFYASELIGMRVYAADVEDDTDFDASARTDWDDIGEINDVVLTRDGDVAALIVGVGGFLGIGEKDVSMQMDQVKIVRENDDSDDFFLVVNASKDMLNEATPYEREMHSDAAHSEMDDVRTVLMQPELQREGYVEAEKAELTSEALTGARVYGINDEDVGEISELILTDSGQIEKTIIDVGGFLGLGEKPIAVTFDELRILRSDDGTDFRVYIDSTEDKLEQQPEYNG